MDTPEPAVLLLMPEASLAPLEPVLAKLGLRAEPQHPGSNDPQLRGWYTLHPTRHIDLDAALLRLREAPGVDGAYRKPQGESPG